MARQAWWPGIEWLLKLRFTDESKNRGGICSSDRLRISLYCLAAWWPGIKWFLKLLRAYDTLVLPCDAVQGSS